MEKRNNADNMGSKKRPAPKEDELIKPERNINKDQIKTAPKTIIKVKSKVK